MTTLATGPEYIASPRSTIRADLFARLVARIADEYEMPAERATRVMEQALAFLIACSIHPHAGLSPSPEVDKGWHAFLLFTREYGEFCQRYAGRFIHHHPGEPDSGVTRVGAAVEAMRAVGLPVDAELWIPSSECSQCYQGCVDDPRN
ncbi:hypothetical protein DP939_44795 [Spongiactinospora rosea]|uniref:Uncharacterized protein n=1 Tax=Spongiactinospora rosea TaxID=2248750 RepID=A0A366LDU6_9ACTN|nr:hypothetical protein [Spongiactinospora rosea]RBQ11663.1 hypothetical protein DP939_44795 [Spongiactinospora rosea]